MSHFNEIQDVVIRRRLEVEERPLKKLAKRVSQVAHLRSANDTKDGTNEGSLQAEFNSYDHTLRRLALLMKANEQEIALYEKETTTIKATHRAAELEITRLKAELKQEQEAQADRAAYDTAALDIQKTAPRSTKAQKVVIAKLREEVAELEREKAMHSETWQVRKSGFEDIMERLALLQKEISGEKADAELRDAAEDSEEDEEGAVPSQTIRPPSEPAHSTEFVDVENKKSDQTTIMSENVYGQEAQGEPMDTT
ncbi:Uncharacterized protein SPCC24B10.11c [Taphrina deformans PYCC 5710]|uniref:Uncharacterized protein SPCC24B10.11c n=1 Tax=Taphrina deformans (strain PYCC 5710 / ATCC 11124 / CBS 356.35 / IMI 108563 / JCM 9778 / NBRC 8474) TaxID=1097556 RepID=R4XC62_TAPDE|nr:Uncharacterized protein SPCC24B10.11c [Taphrina deformans PYCC 5710]|eukprot:CCG83411.1 Uncharacterized protein SPCC24B10.11c [Taphrina deformans PYCC 5710]